MRAAEAYCYARIASRVLGMPLSSRTSVRDLVAANDAIRSKVSGVLLSGVRFTDYRFDADGSCHATGHLTVRQVVDTLVRTVRRYGKGADARIERIENLGRTTRDKQIVAVGRAAPKPAARAAESPAAPVTNEKKVIIERVIRREMVIE
jgi:hypothetical protein